MKKKSQKLRKTECEKIRDGNEKKIKLRINEKMKWKKNQIENKTQQYYIFIYFTKTNIIVSSLSIVQLQNVMIFLDLRGTGWNFFYFQVLFFYY